MIGGLLKSTSRLAVLAAASLFVGGVAMPSAKAADLGGDCCADLEERVAELEATTARKGNRKMSLTVTGQVNRMIMYWDDGSSRGTYYGIDNVNSSSRFSFLGSAKISPTLSAGFEIMIEGEGTAASTRVSQLNEDGSFSSATYMAGAALAGVNNAGNSDGFFGDARRVAAWIEDKHLGRITVGRYEAAGAMGTIDLGGIGVVTGFGSVALLQGNFNLRLKDGTLLSNPWSGVLDPAAYQSRQEVLRYDSPSMGGLVVSASLSESSQGLVGGSNWGVMGRYAGEFSGFRVAAGIGYEHMGDTWTNNSYSAGNIQFPPAPPTSNVQSILTAPLALASPYGRATPDINAWGAALSLMHVPSGLFLQGSYQAVDYNNLGSSTTFYWGDSCAGSVGGGTAVNGGRVAVGAAGCSAKKDANWWQIQGGITKNWTGWGNTSLYGEYARMNNFGAEEEVGRNFTSTIATVASGFGQILNATETKATVWGLGMVQNFDAAATEWYLGYRNYGLDLNADAVCARGDTPNIATTAAAGTRACDGIGTMHLVTTGLRIKF